LDTLKEILDNGYKIFGVSSESGTYHKVELIFKQEDISGSVNSSSLMDGGKFDNVLQLLVEGSATVLVKGAKSFQAGWTIKARENPGSNRTWCHYARKTNIPITRGYTFVGHLNAALLKTAGLMRESGILEMYEKYEGYVDDFARNLKLAAMDYEDALPQPFFLQDWKILSIFLTWASLLGLAFLVIWVEAMTNDHYRAQS
jgi:hypothetical protein